MKRKLSLLMAFMMAATLLPATPSFAASENTMTRVVSLGADDTITTDASIKPVLRLGKGGIKEGPVANDYFELQLGSDASWEYSMEASKNTTAKFPGLSNNVTVVKLTDNILGVTVNESGQVDIPMYVKLNGAPDGTQKVEIIKKESTISGGNYVYANVGNAEAKLRIQKKEKISRSGETLIQFIVDETTRESLKPGAKISLKLPKGFTWDTSKKTGLRNVSLSSMDDDRRLEVTVTSSVDKNKLDALYFSLPVVPQRSARYGDVDVTIEADDADISPSYLVIAEYVPYEVTVKAEKVLNVIAGKDIQGKYISKVTIEEPAISSLQGKRYAEFTFVDENGKEVNASLQNDQKLKLTRKAGNAIVEIDGSSINSVDGAQGRTDMYTVKTKGKDNEKANKFDLFVDKQSSDDKKAKFELEIPFVVASNFTGKLYLQAKGAGIAEQKVLIADVKAPVTFEVKGSLPQVKIGLQKQPGAKIEIKETEAGALQDYVPGKTSNYADYYIKPEENFSLKFKSVEYEVDGTLGIDKVDTANGDANILVRVDRQSTKPSTITLKDITVTLDRTVPYGEIKLKGEFGVVGANQNLTNNVKTFPYFTTITPVNNDKRITTVFKIGEKEYVEIIGGVKEDAKMPVAPFIQNDRTMLPVRYVADALGATVNYDSTTRMATFQRDQIVVALNIDKDVMYVNGSPVKLDSKPTNVDGRIFLPVANISQAFGLRHGKNIIWDKDAKTVTILPQDATEEEIKAATSGNLLENATQKEEAKEEEKKAE